MSIKTIFIRTDTNGDYTWEREFQGVIHAIEVEVGDLSTPDIDLTDDTYSVTFLSVNGLAADAVYYPGEFLQGPDGTDLAAGTSIKAGTSSVCMGVLKLVVAGGGSVKRGRVTILYS